MGVAIRSSYPIGEERKGDASAIPFLVALSGRYHSSTNDRLRV
jgi:hypothetical protein